MYICTAFGCIWRLSSKIEHRVNLLLWRGAKYSFGSNMIGIAVARFIWRGMVKNPV